jgi:hypothetical protein
MATVKFLNAAGKYGDPGARAAVIAYITQKEKTPHGYVGSAAVDLTCAAQQMQAVAESFKKDNKVRIRHFVVSFYPGEIKGPGQANFVALMLSSELAQRYQCVYVIYPRICMTASQFSFLISILFREHRIRDYRKVKPQSNSNKWYRPRDCFSI